MFFPSIEDTSRVAQAVLIGATPPIVLKTPANPGRTPVEVFDQNRAAVLAGRNPGRISARRFMAPTGPARRRRKPCWYFTKHLEQLGCNCWSASSNEGLRILRGQRRFRLVVNARLVTDQGSPIHMLLAPERFLFYAFLWRTVACGFRRFPKVWLVPGSQVFDRVSFCAFWTISSFRRNIFMSTAKPAKAVGRFAPAVPVQVLYRLFLDSARSE